MIGVSMLCHVHYMLFVEIFLEGLHWYFCLLAWYQYHFIYEVYEYIMIIDIVVNRDYRLM